VSECIDHTDYREEVKVLLRLRCLWIE